MKKLTIRFINGSGFVTYAIDKVTDSLWDHTELLTEDNKWLGAHDNGGVQERDFNYCVPTRERRYTLTLLDSQYNGVMAYAKSKIGAKYDFGDILGLLVKDRILNTPDKVICSMFICEALMAGDLTPLNVLANFTYLITPEDLHLSPIFIGKCTYSYPVPFK